MDGRPELNWSTGRNFLLLKGVFGLTFTLPGT
jgi:hypothetical protein